VQIPASTARDVDQAVHAARQAFPTWSAYSKEQRSGFLNKIADLLEKKQEAFAVAEVHDQGKPYSMASKIDIPRSVYNFRFFASAIVHSSSSCTELHHPVRTLNYTRKEPVGVAALIWYRSNLYSH
jgi:acyl-CoA reductase-like NAD-dependent aldehyde dehydrogenase